MCFTVNVNLVKEELENRYGATFLDPDRYTPSYYYHAMSLPEIPVICSGKTDKLQLLKWGLIPSWVKTIDDAGKIRFKTFNARAETIEEKPSFSHSFKSRRCLVPVKGFFEWQHLEKRKMPWYIHHSKDEILSLAGLWDVWVESRTGETYNTFSIVTTEANELMAEIHNSKKRMPVILNNVSEMKWLDISITMQEAHDLLKPCPSEMLRAHTISPLINDKLAIKNTPDLIKPYVWESNSSLF
jgi:putative SOS response-associated peptidase YedK